MPVINACAPGWRYQLALLFAAIPVILYTMWQALALKQIRYLKQRLGFGYPASNDKPIWIHAASVGETLAAEPLIKALRAAHPQQSIVVSTMTPTGASMVEQRLINSDSGIIHYYLPFDWTGAAQRFINTIQPCCALIMETELWPNLYHSCAKQNIRLVIVNGRLSPRSLNTRAWIRQLYNNALQNVSLVLTRSQRDTDGYITLGVDVKRIKLLGNIKYGAAKPSSDIVPITLPRAFVLAASTHENEELGIANQWLSVVSKITEPKPLLVIVPRHPRRSTEILKQLGTLNIPIAARSKGEPISKDTMVYLADTLGELTGFMASAELVIMGGSFAAIGGHNVLEPAMLGKAIIFGPHMHNFADEAEGLLQHKAAIQVTAYVELPSTVLELLQDTPKRHAYGERAQLFMQGNRDIVQRYVAEIESACDIQVS